MVTDRGSIAALIANLERATEPTVDLFRRAFVAVHGLPGIDRGPEPDSTMRLARFCSFVAAEAWTDAALMLLPDRCDAEIRTKIPHVEDDTATASVCRWDDEGCVSTDFWDAAAASPAIALLIAALRAHLALSADATGGGGD